MRFDKLTEYLDSLEQIYGIPSVDCRVTKEHQVVFRHMAGHSDYERKRPVTEHDFYRMYSATKVITMVAVLQLMEKGRLGLYDELRSYLPEFSNMRVAEKFVVEERNLPLGWPKQNDICHLAQHSIRLIDLMSMTAGLSYDMRSEPLMQIKEQSKNQAGTREVVAALAKMPLLYEPGTRWAYSLAHDVLAAVVEEVSGMRFGEYLQKNIFEPLGVEELFFHLDEERTKRVSALYEFHDRTGEIVPADMVRHTTYKITENYESGGGGLIGTTEAYSTIIDALSCGGVGANGRRILSEESVGLLGTGYLTGQMLKDYQLFMRTDYGYGLGVRVQTDSQTAPTPAGEFGWDGAAGAYALVDPVNHISIFYAQHVTDFVTAYWEIHPKVRDLVYEAINE